MYKNSEGYVDPTAGAAMAAVKSMKKKKSSIQNWQTVTTD